MRRDLLLRVSLLTAFAATCCLPRVAAAATSLLIPQATAFSVLGHSCGGIQEQAFATGFDATSGDPIGAVYVQTRCGGSGRGGGYHTTTYSAWIAATWDFTGALVSHAVLASAPAVDPAFSAFDAFGNEVYNQLNAVNVQPASCAVGNTTYCTYRAYLVLASGFVVPPRVTGVSVTSGPATGGTSLTITGTGFTGATDVTFGAVSAASFTVNGDTSITALSPAASAGTVDVVVTNAGGSSTPSAADEFTFLAAPTVANVDPGTGPVAGGTLVTISGANFVDVTSVSFGETQAGFTVDDDATITAVSPPGEAPDTVDVTVVTGGGTSTMPSAFTYVPTAPGSVCGDAVVDPGEECDDGAANGTPGDCCGATCTFVLAGTACADDGSLCTADVCDGGGACVHVAAPALACRPPDVAGGASLVVRRLRSGRNDVQLQWGKGPAVPLTDFGDPTAGESFALCVYDGTGPGSVALAVAGAPSVAEGGTWTRTRTQWKFRSPSGAPDGITSVTLTGAAVPMKAKIQVKATTAALATPLPWQHDPSVVAQLRTSSGACWGASFSSPTIDGGTELKAKSD